MTHPLRCATAPDTSMPSYSTSPCSSSGTGRLTSLPAASLTSPWRACVEGGNALHHREEHEEQLASQGQWYAMHMLGLRSPALLLCPTNDPTPFTSPAWSQHPPLAAPATQAPRPRASPTHVPTSCHHPGSQGSGRPCRARALQDHNRGCGR